MKILTAEDSEVSAEDSEGRPLCILCGNLCVLCGLDQLDNYKPNPKT